MYLKKIKIENFRCFESLEFELHPRLTVLVAPNGGGKTAILDAIAIGLSPINAYLSSANQRLNGKGFSDTDFRIKEDNIKTENIRIEIEAKSAKKNITWDVTKTIHFSKQFVFKIGQKGLSELANSVIKSIDENRKFNSDVYLPTFAYYGARRGYIEVPSRLRKPRDREINYSYPTSALIGALESLTDFKEMLLWFYDENFSELMSKNKKSPEKILPKVRKAIEILLNETYSNPHFNAKHKFIVEREKDKMELQVEQLSQGYQNMLSLAMDFARRLGLAKMPEFKEGEINSIMIIDEIDLHLHPEWQQRVIPDLMRTFPNTQFIVTTHSPQVLTTVKKECVKIVKNIGDKKFIAIEPDVETLGVDNSTAMAIIQGVNSKPNIPEVNLYNELVKEIETGGQKSQELKEKLLKIYGENHYLIQDIEKLERFQNFKKNMNREKSNA